MWDNTDKSYTNRLLERLSGITETPTDDDGKAYDAVMLARSKIKKLYSLSLIHPEHYGGAKIPDPMPQDTATSMIRYEGTITPNALGKFILFWDPMQSSALIANGSTVDGQGNGSFNITVNLPQNNTIVDMYRLVSASIKLTYYGEFNSHKGYLIGATTSNVVNATANTFLTYTNIEDIQTKVLVPPIEGIKIVYTPADNQMLEFSSQTIYDNNTHTSRWKKCMVIIGDALPNTACIRYDIVRNIEYISRLSLREYIKHDKNVTCDFSSQTVQDASSKEVTIPGNLYGRMPTSKYPHLPLDIGNLGSNIKDSFGIVQQGLNIGTQIAGLLGNK